MFIVICTLHVISMPLVKGNDYINEIESEESQKRHGKITQERLGVQLQLNCLTILLTLTSPREPVQASGIGVKTADV